MTTRLTIATAPPAPAALRHPLRGIDRGPPAPPRRPVTAEGPRCRRSAAGCGPQQKRCPVDGVADAPGSPARPKLVPDSDSLASSPRRGGRSCRNRPVRARAVPASGLRSATGRRLRTHRDPGRERAADSAHRRIYRRPCRPPGPSRAAARTGGGPKGPRISERLGVWSRQVTANVVCAIGSELFKWGARFYRCLPLSESATACRGGCHGRPRLIAPSRARVDTERGSDKARLGRKARQGQVTAIHTRFDRVAAPTPPGPGSY
jgi:hypothetical protein